MNFERKEYEPAVTYLEHVFAPDGWAAKMLRPIGKVDIRDRTLAEVFQLFLKRVDVGETFTLSELLTTPEFVLNRFELVGHAGDGIYRMQSAAREPRLHSTLMSHSVQGLGPLLLATGGAEIQMPADVTPEQLFYERLVILREKDGERLAASDLVNLTRVGTVQPGALTFCKDGTVTDVRVAELVPTDPAVVDLGAEQAMVFEQAFHGSLAFLCSVVRSGTYYLNLPADRSLADFTAAVLGMFAASMRYRFSRPPMRHQNTGKVGLVVPKPVVSVGDCVYAFRPKCGADGWPMNAELVRLQGYLAVSAREGKIKGVLPLKKNAGDMVARLCDSEMEYVPERDFPTEGFAVLAVLPAGTETPGTRLGRFQFR